MEQIRCVEGRIYMVKVAGLLGSKVKGIRDKGPSTPPMGTTGSETPSWNGCSVSASKVRDPPKKFVDKTSGEQ
eukprot:12884594-Prorocentrum_lima.AAC.1